MPKIDITRTELVWPGKYDDNGELVPPRRVNLPFQVIERVNETRATREQREEALQGHVGTLFDYWQADEQQADPGDGWRNKLIWGDNLYVMGSLLERFAGQIDLIYIDPPFATGADFSFKTKIGDDKVVSIEKEQSLIEEKAYRDTWGQGMSSYLGMLSQRLALMRDLLAPMGNIYVHLDYRVSHQIKLILDEIFGEHAFQNEVVWHFNSGAREKTGFGKRHHLLLRYSGGETPYFDEDSVRVPYSPDINIPASKAHYYNPLGKVRDDVWEVPIIAQNDKKERVGYQTQKPLELLDIVVSSSCPANGIVADFFAGSGTTLISAESLGRRWIGCDMSRYAIHTTRKRLMEIPDCRPFEILNLGQYERQVWQGVAFGGGRRTAQMRIYEYLKFILDLYGAQPLAGTQHLHGKKGSAVVHVGAVDAPVTIDEIDACLAECATMGQKELHVLGWEWEMGLNDLMVEEAKGQGIKLLLLAIPREVMEQQAVDQGDIRFHQLAYLEVEIAPAPEKRAYTAALTDFGIPNDELIPPEVREKIVKWSDYVDYWAVDWDFRSDTFVNAWTAYRTRQDRTLELQSDPHAYDAPGTYRVLVKVIDIFGNDTSQVYELEVE